MGTTQLMDSAQQLIQPSVKAATEFESKRDILAVEMNELMLKRLDLVMLIGDGNISMMEDNHRNHLRFISSLFLNYNPNVFVETILWVFRAYRSHGFNLTYWPAQLSQWVELFKIHLSHETFDEIYPFYNWMIINQPNFVIESDKIIMNLTTPSHG